MVCSRDGRGLPAGQRTLQAARRDGTTFVGFVRPFHFPSLPRRIATGTLVCRGDELARLGFARRQDGCNRLAYGQRTVLYGRTRGGSCQFRARGALLRQDGAQITCLATSSTAMRDLT